jgi:outer membrane protein assembly factor BamB
MLLRQLWHTSRAGRPAFFSSTPVGQAPDGRLVSFIRMYQEVLYHGVSAHAAPPESAGMARECIFSAWPSQRTRQKVLHTMMNRACRLLFLVFSLAAAAFAVNTPEWPQFRGPQGNPVSQRRLPDSWSKTENIEWVAEIPGRGWSSPIVAGNRIFLTAVVTEGKSKQPQIGTDYSNDYMAELMKQGLSENEADAKVMERDFEMPNEVMLHYFVYCFELRTGKLIWKQEYSNGHPPGGRHRKNSFASETPVTDGKHVYVYATNLGLYAYDLNGKQFWKTPLEAYPIFGDFGTGASPALAGDRLLIVNDNEKQQFIAAFDKNTGKQIWRTNRDLTPRRGASRRSGWSTPYVWTTPGRAEVVTIGPGFAVSYDLSGKELWRLSGMSGGPIPSPYVCGGLLFLNGGKGGGLFAVKSGALGDISPAAGRPSEFLAWSQERGGTYLATQVTYQGAVYALSEVGILSRYEAQTGKLGYRARIEGGNAFTSSPWAYDGKIFCLSEEGKTFVIEAGEEYKLLKVNELDEMAQATPALVGDRLLLRTETRMYSIRKGR